MANTMAELRVEVAKRLRDTLHGREIDTLEKGVPEIEHMLGIVTIGAISTEQAEANTLLDPTHEFWENYYTDIDTKNAVKKEIKTAMTSLKEDDIFRVTSPYGEDAGIVYTEVDDIESEGTEMITTVCAECGGPIQTEPEITHHYGRYDLTFELDCQSCDFSSTFGADLRPMR